MSGAQDLRGRVVIVTGVGQVTGLAGAANGRHGRIDGLVNNAGVSLHDQAIEQLDLGEFRRFST